MLLNLSYFMHDLKKLNDILGYQLECMLTAYLADGAIRRGAGPQHFLDNRDTSA